MLLMIAGWTAILYFFQEYRSPTYQMHFSTCLRNAAWFTPVSGSGPLLPLVLRPISRNEQAWWVPPALGAIVYVVMAAIVGRTGHKWSARWQLLLGLLWICAGAVVFLTLSVK